MDPIPNIATDALQTRVKQSKSDADTFGGGGWCSSPLICCLLYMYNFLFTLLFYISFVSLIDFSLQCTLSQQQQHEVMPRA